MNDMKKNKVMRLASSLLVAALLTTSAVSGTFAKYVTSTTGTDTARVAYWGFKAQQESSITLTNLFEKEYTNSSTGTTTVKSQNQADVMAPGTGSKESFSFVYVDYNKDGTQITAPEVDYTFTVSVDGSECDSDIKNNTNIQWKLDSGDWGTWDKLMTSIKSLSGDESGTKTYKAGELPTKFYGEEPDDDIEHTVYWQWVFETDTGDGQPDAQDKIDTAMGNAEDLADVTLKITVTATQID